MEGTGRVNKSHSRLLRKPSISLLGKAEDFVSLSHSTGIKTTFVHTRHLRTQGRLVQLHTKQSDKFRKWVAEVTVLFLVFLVLCKLHEGAFLRISQKGSAE